MSEKGVEKQSKIKRPINSRELIYRFQVIRTDRQTVKNYIKLKKTSYISMRNKLILCLI